MEFLKTLQNAAEIPDGNFSGYFWFSDSVEVELIENKPIEKERLFISQIPFVIEANFFCSKRNLSVSVKNVDGVYYYNLIDLNKVSSEFKSSRVYKSVVGRPFYLPQNLERI